MSTEQSNEAFEKWWEVNYHNGNPPRFGWKYWRDGDGYKTDDDESELDCMWQAWQASRAVLVVELPEPFKLAKASSGLTYYYEDEVDKALRAAGITVKEG